MSAFAYRYPNIGLSASGPIAVIAMEDAADGSRPLSGISDALILRLLLF
jgi:hypothetical protein